MKKFIPSTLLAVGALFISTGLSAQQDERPIKKDDLKSQAKVAFEKARQSEQFQKAVEEGKRRATGWFEKAKGIFGGKREETPVKR